MFAIRPPCRRAAVVCAMLLASCILASCSNSEEDQAFRGLTIFFGDDHGTDHGRGDGGNPSTSSSPSPDSSPSDIRLKRDIQQVGRLGDGIRLYRFRFKWSDQEYVGVIAQEVERIAPKAVSRGADGYLRVDYAQLGIHLESWDEWLRSHRRSAAR